MTRRMTTATRSSKDCPGGVMIADQPHHGFEGQSRPEQPAHHDVIQARGAARPDGRRAGRLPVTSATIPPPRSAEVAFTVPDNVHNRGVGTLLMEHLISLARGRGLHAFTAETLSENAPMLRVFADAGLQANRTLADGVYDLTFPPLVVCHGLDPAFREPGHGEDLLPWLGSGAAVLLARGVPDRRSPGSLLHRGGHGGIDGLPVPEGVIGGPAGGPDLQDACVVDAQHRGVEVQVGLGRRQLGRPDVVGEGGAVTVDGASHGRQGSGAGVGDPAAGDGDIVDLLEQHAVVGPAFNDLEPVQVGPVASLAACTSSVGALASRGRAGSSPPIGTPRE
jgi:GNAT superfamily N-acetyltransferase